MRTIAAILLVAWTSGCWLLPREERNPAPGRVLLIGVDGADWDILEPLIAAGRMPNLARLMARGSYGDLETIEPILSPIIWTTIATGRKPQEHGITWFMERSADGTSKPVTSRRRRAPALWTIASEAGRSVGVIGWWATWPAETVNGYIVSDHVAAHGFGLSAAAVQTDLGKTYPASLAKTVERYRVRPSMISNAEVLSFMNIGPQELATRNGDALNFSNPLHHFLYALAGHRTYEQLGVSLLRNEETDLSLHYFEATDSLSHLFMKYTDPPLKGIKETQRQQFKDIVPRIYEEQDRVLGRLLDAAGPEANVVIVSDHGFKTGNERLVEDENTRVDRAHLWHTKKGVIIASGPAFRAGVRLNASIYDVTPTVLYLLNLPVGQTMTGRVLEEAITPSLLKEMPPRVTTYPFDTRNAEPDETEVAESSGIDDQMLAQLEALGYVDTDTTPELSVNEAKTALLDGDPARAATLLEELLAAHPDHAPAIAAYAESLSRLGKHHEALAQYRTLDKTEFRDEPAFERGELIALFMSGEQAAALESAKRRVIDLGTPEDYLLLTQLLSRAEKQEAAIAVLKHALAKIPNDMRVVSALALRQIERDALGDAVALLKRYADDEPGLEIVRGHLAARRGDIAAAIGRWTRAAQRDPKGVEVRLLLGRAYLSQGLKLRAEKWIDEASKLSSSAEVQRLKSQLQ
ncbi:MAG: alkaline phosphatase family protein [Myxococcota bacterium]